MRPAPTEIHKLLSRPIPEKLWHYTSFEGLRGIVESGTIFASDIRFLNDRHEFIHIREFVAKHVAGLPEIGTEGFEAKAFASNAMAITLNDGVLEPNFLCTFVASFSAVGDQLSQWRGYSHNTSGVSIAFDLREGFRPPLDEETFVTFAPCVYKPEQKDVLVKAALDELVSGMEGYAVIRSNFWKEHKRWPGIGDSEHRQYFGILRRNLGRFMQLAALLKDSSFHEEKEWRLILPSSEPWKSGIVPLYRATTNAIIPCLPFETPNGSLPITEVLLGPGSHPSAKYGVEAFLKSKGLPIPVRESAVPYRPW